MKNKNSKYKKIIVAALLLTLVLSIGAVGLTVGDNTFRNDTPTYMTLNTAVVGTVKDQDDYESYILEVPSNGSLYISLNHEDMAESLLTGWVVTLYSITNGSGTNKYMELTYFDSFWSDLTSSWDAVGVTPGNYLITVKSGTYNLETEFTLSASFMPTEAYEKEFNDTPETAGSLEIGTPVFGSSSQRSTGSDLDYYKISLPYNGVLYLSFSHEDGSLPQVGWNIGISDLNGNNLCEFSSKWSDLEVSSGGLGLKQGDYLITVEPVVVNAMSYKLLVEAGQVETREQEPNDSDAAATLLENDTTFYGSLSPRLLGLDKDFYKFTVTDNGYIDAYFTHAKGTEDKNGWNFRVLMENEDGSLYEITKQVSKWNDGGVSIRGLGLKTGTYYLCVDADSMSYNSLEYNVRWMFTADTAYEAEPNYTARRANEIVTGTSYYGALISTDVNFDVDYYAFTVEHERNIKLEFFHDMINGTDATWDVSILDSDNTVISELHSTQSESVVYTDLITLSPGTYYVRVETGLYGSANKYHFRVIV